MKYDAFISYRHAPLDIEVSEALHKNLESYRVPRAVQKKSGKKRINRIFRDREELPVSSNLSENIQNALENSEYLVVICSPRTPESEWVRKEIEYFVKHKGHDKILALLIEGEPEESFPDLLRRREETKTDKNGKETTYITEIEPLAADIRASDARSRKKALKTEVMRIAAPLLNCSFDDLRQRHRARRNRRIFAGVLSITLAATIFGVYNYIQTERIRQNYRKQQEIHSMFLSDTAIRLLESGDRTKAIQIALEALPSDLENPERPIVPQAEYALSRAVNAYARGHRITPMYSVELDDLHGKKAAISSEGEIFAVIDQRGALYIFNGQDGSLTQKMTPNRDDNLYAQFMDVHILTDKRVLAMAEDHILCLDGVTGEILWTQYYIEEHDETRPRMIRDAYTISQNEELFAVSMVWQNHQILLLISLENGEIYQQIDIEQIGDRTVSSIAISLDNRYIAVGGSFFASYEDNAQIYVFDTRLGEQMRTIELQHAVVNHLLFSDQHTVVCMDYISTFHTQDMTLYGEVSKYNWQTGDRQWYFEYTQTEHLNEGIYSKLFLAETEYAEEYVVFVSENIINVISSHTGEVVQNYQLASNIVGIFTDIPSGISLVATVRGTSHMVNIYTGTEIRENNYSINAEMEIMLGAYNLFLYMPYNTKTIAAYGFYEDPEFDMIIDLDLNTDQNSPQYVSSISVSPDNRYTIIVLEAMDVDNPSEIIICETNTLQIIAEISNLRSINDIAYLEEKIWIIDDQGYMHTYDMRNQEMRETDIHLRDNTHIDVALSMDGTRILKAASDEISVINTVTQEIVYNMRNSRYIDRHGLSNTGRYLWYIEAEDLFIIDINHSKIISLKEDLLDVEATYDSQWVKNAQIIFSADDHVVAIPVTNYSFAIIDLSNGNVLHTFEMMIDSYFTGHFSEDHSIFIFQASDYFVRAIDTNTGELLYSSDHIEMPIQSWQSNSARNVIASRSSTEGVIYTLGETIHPIARVPHMHVISPCGQWIFVGYSWEAVRFPFYNLADLIEKAHDALGDNELSEENRIKYYVDS